MSQPPNTQTPPARRRTGIYASLLGVILLSALGLAVWKSWPKPPPPPINSDPVDLVKFVGTPQFESLPWNAQDQYVDRLMQEFPTLVKARFTGQITDDEARKGMQNSIAARMNRHLDEYYKLPAGPSRVKYLDKLIDEQENQRLLYRAVSAALGASGPGMPSLNGPKMKNRIESLTPLQRSQRGQFFGDIQRRRDQRGLNPIPGAGVK